MKLEVITKNEGGEIQNGIISKLRELIISKNLEPGDKLPSERELSNKFDVTRNNLREAIQLLEFYGILKSKPQSGTFIADIGQIAMNGMLEDILRLREPDFKSLVETRILLELMTCKLAAERRTLEQLSHIEHAMEAYKKKVSDDRNAVQEDLLFHLAIARASGNSTMNRFMLIITPEIITNFEKYHVCDKDRAFTAIGEHIDIYEAIKAKDPQLAEQKMKIHFNMLYEYCYNMDNRQLKN